MINEGKVNIVIFLRDHEVTHNHQDIQDLLVACNINNVPLATNKASAKLLILGLLQFEKTHGRR